MIQNYHKTREAIPESTAIILFPDRGTSYHTKKFLKEHLGMDKESIEKVINIKSKWAMIYKKSPLTLVTEDEILILY
jgi:hypothetical protein